LEALLRRLVLSMASLARHICRSAHSLGAPNAHTERPHRTRHRESPGRALSAQMRSCCSTAERRFCAPVDCPPLRRSVRRARRARRVQSGQSVRARRVGEAVAPANRERGPCPRSGSLPSSGPHFPTTGAACIYGVARCPGRSPELAAAVVAGKHQAGRDVFRGPPRRERVQELNPASEWLETMAELEVTDGACRLCGSPTRLVWAAVRAENGRLIERRLLRMVYSSRECLALDVSVRAAEAGGRAADRARS
jgi:hypothetical protein